ncbi:hypothetical protein CN326_04320 [Bacillus sp. AFS018417]|nr:hypothetical protein CN326_04320 [Bacillus sp. AFS018417]
MRNAPRILKCIENNKRKPTMQGSVIRISDNGKQKIRQKDNCIHESVCKIIKLNHITNLFLYNIFESSLA